MTRLYSLILIILIAASTTFAQDESSAEDYFVKGEVYASVGQLPEAIMSYEIAIAKDSTNALYYYALGLAQIRHKRLGEAIDAFNTTIELDSNNLDAHLKLALIAKDDKDYEMAIKHLDEAFRITPDLDRKLAYKTRIINILDKTGKFDQAGPHLEDAKSVHPQNSYILYMDAKYHNYVTKNYELAKTSMQIAIDKMEEEKGKAHDHYYYELGFAHHSLEEYENATSAFSQVTNGKIKSKTTSMSPKYQYQLALSHFQMYDIKRSEKILNAVIKMNNSFEPAYDLLIEIKENTLDRHEVVKLLEHKVSIQMDNTRKVRILADLIDLEIKYGDYANAKKHIKEFEQCGIPLPDVRFMEAIIDYKENKFDDARDKLLTIMNTKESKTKYKALMLIGMIQMYEKNYEAAKITFSQNFPGEFKVASREYLKSVNKEVDIAKKNK
ncbi:DUF3808 domain-containing protein [Flammeovirga yaeyamensis]|uniref:DUF3808 domain-containing protein n=1 Tax=Flammeovirga yaeyamensis TaxID=367791 RepID=A0AAX1N0N5_9BACT|nr:MULTISPECIES: tetratricopeptide repeat protein [Flammeovirga]ANQ47541.1 DUF3808 domain-containing protein [Flammeovirga sp. MY04]MBB3698580.1 tetratricopeptide (TPR) repeat protein [Flammeovirga yaeyamensis]NMF34071.1 DUF3808 domain-containing protein [Flammeovirga yaeyamensis]QWG01059.1 DUF3808 domain-containing protein [Flammeovirga yaeyamensis]